MRPITTGTASWTLVVTNYDLETNALYRYQGNWLFGDERWRSGLARNDRFLLGFGAGFLDFDNDGDRDLLVVNGHVVDNIERIQPDLSHPQPDQLFENRGGRFLEHEPFYRWSSRQPRVGRGMALGDIDNDGDIDVLISNCGAGPALLLNRVGARKNWIQLRLTGTDSSRDAVGTRLTLTTSEGRQTDQVTGGGSYLSAGDLRAHFGLGEAARVERDPDPLAQWKRGSPQGDPRQSDPAGDRGTRLRVLDRPRSPSGSGVARHVRKIPDGRTADLPDCRSLCLDCPRRSAGPGRVRAPGAWLRGWPNWPATPTSFRTIP